MEEHEKKTWDLERQVFQLKMLLEIAQALSRCRKQEDVYVQILATIAGTFGARHALALANENGRWRCMAMHGVSKISRDEFEQQLDLEFEAATAMRQQEILCEMTDHRSNDDLTFSLWEHLHVKNQVVGGFFFGKKILVEPYSRDDEHLLKAVCSYAANALENIYLYNELNAAKEKLAAENLTLRQQVRREDEGKKIIGSSPAIKKILENTQSFGRSGASVLISGETGTGKELIARAIHYASFRASDPFVAINCTAIPENLVESEFFGIEAGTATGVRQHIGYFEQANAGTLFIDEVGDMPLNSQAKLLRTLQEQTLRRVGGTREIKVNVRVVAATNKDIKAEIKAGRFREDLFYRLSVLELRLPPLRLRREDIAILAHHFIEKIQEKVGRKDISLSSEALKVLEKYVWPGNIRELENEIERLVTLAENGETISPSHLSSHFFEETTADLTPEDEPQNLREAVDRLETRMIEKSLKETGGNKSEVARRLGLSRLGLQRKMERLKITYRGHSDDFADEA